MLSEKIHKQDDIYTSFPVFIKFWLKIDFKK